MRLFATVMGVTAGLTMGSGLGLAAEKAAPPVTASTTKAGVDAWKQGDYAKAVAIWRPLAQAGDADAQFNLGQAYKLGRSVPVDISAALDWYRKAAALGHYRAEDNLGLLLFQQNRREEAMPYIRKSADRGEARAQYLLATAMYNGDLAERDWVKAYALMTQAARDGLPQASTSLKVMDQNLSASQRIHGLELAKQMSAKDKVAAITPTVPLAPRPPIASAPAPSSPARAKNTPPAAAAPAAPANSAASSTPAKAPVPSATTPSPAPKTAAPKTGEWRIQLGAFSEEARANSLWTGLLPKISALSAYKPILVKTDGLVRLQTGPLGTKADADKLCGAVRAAGAACMVKPG